MKELQRRIHSMAIDKGFWPIQGRNFGEVLCLVHSEASEALECWRSGEMELSYENGKPTGFPSEIADIVIRCLDLAEACGFDLLEVIREKVEYNSARPHLHGRER